MPRRFDVTAKRTTVELPSYTREQLAALMGRWEIGAREVIIRLLAEESRRGARDLEADIDSILARLDMEPVEVSEWDGKLIL